MTGRDWIGWTLSPKPPGMGRLGLHQQKGGPDDRPGGRSSGGSHFSCLQVPVGARASVPAEPYPPLEQRGLGFTTEWGVSRFRYLGGPWGRKRGKAVSEGWLRGGA